MRALLLSTAVLLSVASAHAADITRSSTGYTYFYRPGANFAAHDADLNVCRQIAVRLHQPAPQATVVTAGGIYGGMGAALGMIIVQAVNDVRARPSNVENCMVVRGWRVVEIDKAEGVALTALDRKTQQQRVGVWIGADQPHGTVVRSFGNEVATLPPGAVFIPASNFGNTALSVKLAASPPPQHEDPPPDMPRSARPPKPVNAQDLGGIPAGAGVVVASVDGTGGISLVFERIGANPHAPAWVDGKPGSFEVRQAGASFASANGARGQLVAFVVPPGRWRLAHEDNGQMSLSFCEGGPAFDIGAGEVVYAGAFDPYALGHPDLDLAPVKAVLPSLSGLADKIRPASYLNGAEGLCNGSYAYALEFDGAPFIDGYRWGSRAAPLPSPPPRADPAPAAPVTSPAAATPNAPPSPPAPPTPAPVAAATPAATR